MISIERGLEIVASVAAEHARPEWMPSESVSLTASVSRILRETIVSDTDSPAFDKAIRDGFAVRSEDLKTIPANLKIVGESRAGAGANVIVRGGECCEIMTGAPMPEGANAVVMVEYTDRLPANFVRILKPVRPNAGFLRCGAETHKEDRLLEPGTKLGVAEIALLASAGKASVLVSKRPRVAILATGDELVDISKTPGDGQIRNSNGHTLFVQCTFAGAQPELLGIARDKLEDLRAKIRPGLDYDILLVSGGVSMGKYDLVEKVFAEFGVEVFFDKVAMKPGKPTVFGFHGQTFVFGLPGNPVSTMVAFHMFVKPVIQSLLKATAARLTTLEAIVEAPANCDSERVALVPAVVRFENAAYRIAPVPWKGSSDLAGLSKANALIFIPRREGVLQRGDTAQFILMD